MTREMVPKNRNSDGLRRSDLDPDPVQQFGQWLSDAWEANIQDANATALATASADGRPDIRTVLLKGFDRRGFVFYTNYESKKARDISENPHVALLFLWVQLRRQVRICGTAQKITTADSLRYFLSRPLGSRLGAWSSHQSSVITSRQILDMKMHEMKRKFASGKVSLPSFWGGYRVNAESMEFWQGCEDRLHDRFLYTREPGNNWRIERLAP